MRARLREWVASLPSIAVLSAAALAIGSTIAVLLTATDSLSAGVFAALTPPATAPQFSGGMVLITDEPPTGVVLGIYLALRALLLGGVPAAFLATVVAWPRHRLSRPKPDAWGSVVWLALMFQISSVGVTTLVLAFVLSEFGLEPLHRWDAWPLIGVPAAMLACGAWGVRCWRTLQTGSGQGIAGLGAFR